MTSHLLTITCTFSGDGARLRAWLADAAGTIPAVDGLCWKIWGFDHDWGLGTSAYGFEDAASAAAFARGPLVAALRAHPAVRSVAWALAPIDRDLSARTGAAGLLARPRKAAAREAQQDLEGRYHLAVG
jgi:hypothetical protein